MKPLFKYIDYRVFLEDFYHDKKRSMRCFSYRYFAQKAGVKSPIFLKQVIDGKRNLTRRMIEQFIPALNFNKKEALFFKNLVLFNQAKNAVEKQEHYSVMLSMMDYVNEHQITADQYLYFEKWSTGVIRELICLYDFKDDCELIAGSLRPPIKTGDVKKAIALLLRLKLVARQNDGTYRQTNAAIISSDPMVALARRSFNSEMLTLARNANEAVLPEERNISGITMGISKACYDVLLAEMAAFKERVKVIVNQDERSSRVYQLNLQLFPLSRDVAEIPAAGKGRQPCAE
ncbi:MAG: TIGR02147 family protein [Chitinispirillaceae bacterium]|nr:TIGR02147 family protein [Chitinispirillaceae bacterium]